MRFLYFICRFVLWSIYGIWIRLFKKFPKYRDRLKLYRYELKRKTLLTEAKSSSVHLYENVSKDGHKFKMLLNTPGKIEDQLIALNKFEDHITKLMPNFMVSGEIFLDIGANIGFHTFNILSHFENISAYCFEPNPSIKTELDRNIRLNRWQDRISTSSIALSDQVGEFDFYVMPSEEQNRGMSSLERKAVDARFHSIKIQTEPLDSLWPKLNPEGKRVALIKIDTQGHEEAVIRGMLKTIEKDRPTLFLEFETHLTHNKENLWNLYRMLEESFNYEFFIIHKNTFILEPISFAKDPMREYSEDIFGQQRSLR